jgi:hypothetical protein
VHRRELGFQAVHPAQRDRDGLRACRGQADVLTALQQSPRPRVRQAASQARHALVEQRGVDPLGPGGVLLAQVAVELEQRPQLPDLLRRDPRARHPALGHQGPQQASVGLIGLRPFLRASLVRGVGRLGQQCRAPGPLQLLDDELPPRAALHRERHVRLAGEAAQPLPQLQAARRVDPAPAHLPGHGVQVIEGDLSTVNVKPSYDGHYRDLLTLPKSADAPRVR